MPHASSAHNGGAARDRTISPAFSRTTSDQCWAVGVLGNWRGFEEALLGVVLDLGELLWAYRGEDSGTEGSVTGRNVAGQDRGGHWRSLWWRW
jgi:hypothetical protein